MNPTTQPKIIEGIKKLRAFLGLKKNPNTPPPLPEEITPEAVSRKLLQTCEALLKIFRSQPKVPKKPICHHDFNMTNYFNRIIAYHYNEEEETVLLTQVCSLCKNKYPFLVGIELINGSPLYSFFKAPCTLCSQTNASNSKMLLPCKCIIHKQCLKEQIKNGIFQTKMNHYLACVVHQEVIIDERYVKLAINEDYFQKFYANTMPLCKNSGSELKSLKEEEYCES